MKTFVPTFLAILAAAAVIVTALWAKQRIDQWERAKEMCYAQVETEMKMMQVRATRDQSEMRSMAQSAMDSQGIESSFRSFCLPARATIARPMPLGVCFGSSGEVSDVAVKVFAGERANSQSCILPVINSGSGHSTPMALLI